MAEQDPTPYPHATGSHHAAETFLKTQCQPIETEKQKIVQNATSFGLAP